MINNNTGVLYIINPDPLKTKMNNADINQFQEGFQFI